MKLFSTILLSSALTLSTFASEADSVLNAPINKTASCKLIRASGNAEYPPYLWHSDKSVYLHGAIAMLLKELAQEINTEIELVYSGPWGRVQEDVAAGRIDMIAGAFFTLPRTHYMDYVYPDMMRTKTAVWVNTKNPFPFTQWKDLKNYRGVTVINNSFGQEFDEYAKKQLTIEEVGSLDQGLRMLSANRVDYLIYEENPGKAYAQKLNIRNLQAMPLEITRQSLYLTMSKQSACNSSELRAKISKALKKFTQEKRAEFLIARAHTLWSDKQQDP
ncbi:substrate-binding periplasmic protein [Neptunomonas japonica]|uniref:Polar amino acid transport system substrate-binding protein n=1 Tax=Neptunomonas japonica JAMM 1380 TaxID=1441457 RepID=A0A7R6SVY2_9GAMM|nr:transporter substrate-binding domain-containing protein [Neptunomonas japonica]BBB29190.1 polar amino acid transport system substrate-binding protein [Neptunomonas japonica JAMM 1380]